MSPRIPCAVSVDNSTSGRWKAFLFNGSLSKMYWSRSALADSESTADEAVSTADEAVSTADEAVQKKLTRPMPASHRNPTVSFVGIGLWCNMPGSVISQRSAQSRRDR